MLPSCPVKEQKMSLEEVPGERGAAYPERAGIESEGTGELLANKLRGEGGGNCQERELVRGEESSLGMSAEFVQLWAGVSQPCCLLAPASPPPWLDPQLYHAGLAFYANLLGVVASNGEALVMGLAIPSFYRVLAFSGQTNRKREALARYRDTAFHVYGRWYGGGSPWIETTDAARSLRAVNAMHRRVAEAVAALPHQEFDCRVEAQFLGPDGTELDELEQQAEILFSDLAALRVNFPMSPEYRAFVGNPLKFTQFDMVLVQCAFFAAPFVYPTYYGCPDASSAELAGFLHVWRVFGYYLGIGDSFNGAQFDVATTRQLGAEIMERILKPCLLNLDRRTIWMGQQIFRDPSNYYVWLYRNYAMLGFQLRGLWASFGWRQKYWYYLRTAIVSYIYPLPGIKWAFNRLLKRLVDSLTRHLSKKQV